MRWPSMTTRGWMIAVAIFGLLFGGLVESRRLRARWDRFRRLAFEHRVEAMHLRTESRSWLEYAQGVEADARGEKWKGLGPMVIRGYRTDHKEMTTKPEDTPARRREIAAEAREFGEGLARKALTEEARERELEARW